ncbi:Uncharacterised protein [Salmonella enterica subsp. enterica serovar Bovismorbificans]|nr:Uncharacterised protein [Salmonella enterica subsp. enterica serovar Bovismorbificans]
MSTDRFSIWFWTEGSASANASLMACTSGAQFSFAAITASCPASWCASRLSSAVSAIPASGMLESSPPKPIGSSSNGSNFFAIASHSSSRLTSSMMAWPAPRCISPMP